MFYSLVFVSCCIVIVNNVGVVGVEEFWSVSWVFVCIGSVGGGEVFVFLGLRWGLEVCCYGDGMV